MAMSSQSIGPQSLDKILEEMADNYMSQSLITQAEITFTTIFSYDIELILVDSVL